MPLWSTCFYPEGGGAPLLISIYLLVPGPIYDSCPGRKPRKIKHWALPYGLALLHAKYDTQNVSTREDVLRRRLFIAPSYSKMFIGYSWPGTGPSGGGQSIFGGKRGWNGLEECLQSPFLTNNRLPRESGQQKVGTEGVTQRVNGVGWLRTPAPALIHLVLCGMETPLTNWRAGWSVIKTIWWLIKTRGGGLLLLSHGLETDDGFFCQHNQSVDETTLMLDGAEV